MGTRTLADSQPKVTQAASRDTDLCNHYASESSGIRFFRKADMTPLTHHDIVRLAAPFTALGLRVDLAASVRAERRVRFKPRDLPLAGDEISTVHHELSADRGDEISIRRAVWHPDGVASVVQASGRDGRQLAEALDVIPLSDQLFQTGTSTCVRSLRLWLADDGPRCFGACRADASGCSHTAPGAVDRCLHRQRHAGGCDTGGGRQCGERPTTGNRIRRAPGQAAPNAGQWRLAARLRSTAEQLPGECGPDKRSAALARRHARDTGHAVAAVAPLR